MKRLFNPSKVQPIALGVYHRQSTPSEQPPYRVHLRLQADGSGVLVLNAATVMHLNPTAAEYAYHFIKGTDTQVVAREVASRYRVSRDQALHDFEDFTSRIETLASGTDVDPVAFLDFERVAPHATNLTAPLRVDCALTYRLPDGAGAEDAPSKRVDRELTTAEWTLVLDQLWQVGVPHVTFTGGEPTLRPDLMDLIRHAEALGQVCGLLTDGLKFVDRAYLSDLLMSGLDHVLMLLHPRNPESWKAIETTLAEDISVTVHLTVKGESQAGSLADLERLAGLGVRAVSISFADSAIQGTELVNRAAGLGLALKYDLPVPYSADHPVARETADDAHFDGAGKTWLYIEPDGDVLPAQGLPDRVLGNILRDPWERIYRA